MIDLASNNVVPARSVEPVAAGERYLALDALRGLALFGVLLVNDLDFFRISLFQQLLVFHTHAGWANRAVDVLVAGLLEFKAFTIFSFLFGVGIAIQTERLAAQGLNQYGFLARRFALLLGLGILHMFFISNVDILCLYGICGLLLLGLLRCATAPLAFLGLGAIALTFILPFGELLPAEKMMREHAIAATSVYSTDGFREILVFRWHETWQFILPLLLSVLPRTAGVMLLGVAAWRAGVLRRPDPYRRWLIVTILAAGSLGALATSLVVYKESSGHPALAGIPSALLDGCASIPLAFAYTSAFLLWMNKRPSGKFLTSVAALGQMALSNYLLQSVILGFIFYGYGGGLLGRLSPLAAALLGLLIYLGQLGFSRAWLKHYRFGPAEWLWRSLTYRKWQAMRQMKRADIQPLPRQV